MASTQHALRNLRASLRSAKQPRTHFANSLKYNYKVPEVQVSKIQVFYGQVCTRTPFKHRKCYSPMSRQARVLVVQASIAAYLQDLLLRFFFLWFAQHKKVKNSYWPATYEGNFSCVLNQEFLFFGSQVVVFTSNPSRLKYWLLIPFYMRKPCAKAVPETDYFTQQKQYHKRNTLRTWTSQSQERDAEWSAPTGHLIHGASVLLGT